MLTIILIAVATFIATFVGGLVALKFKDKLHLILGFSAGAVIAVALFDLLPESIALGQGYFQVSTITSLVGLGFLIYLILDRSVFLHTHEGLHESSHENLDRIGQSDFQLNVPGEVHNIVLENECENGLKHLDVNANDDSSSKSKGSILGVSTLSFHSFLDGIAIGLAFQIGTAVGAIVAVAVLIHDFSDGVNTVSMVLRNDGSKKKAFRWLLADAIAPVLGVCATFFFTLPQSALAIILAMFSGFFLYISASDLIPESHHAHPKFLTTFMTILGATILFVAIQLVKI